MIKISNRFKKSYIKRRFQKKSKRNGQYLKRGGDLTKEEIQKQLVSLRILREKERDFGLGEKLGLDNPLLVQANFGFRMQQFNVSKIGEYNDDFIIELTNYDISSIYNFLIKNNPTLDAEFIHEYLPSNMWHFCGGVNNFFKWILQKIISTNPVSNPDKPQITKDTILMITEKLKKKYPTINLYDSGIRNLFLKDLFKKIYYLDFSNLPKQVQSGGGAIIGTMSIIWYILCDIWHIFIALPGIGARLAIDTYNLLDQTFEDIKTKGTDIVTTARNRSFKEAIYKTIGFIF